MSFNRIMRATTRGYGSDPDLVHGIYVISVLGSRRQGVVYVRQSRVCGFAREASRHWCRRRSVRAISALLSSWIDPYRKKRITGALGPFPSEVLSSPMQT
jgi:hypothetical protein